MRRRQMLRLTLVGTAWLATSAHTPYRQWQVYRRKHLLIGTSKADAPSYPLGQRIAEVLATHLPASQAQGARGPNAWRLASLITSGQIEVVLLSKADLEALRDGRQPFAAFGPTRLAELHRFGDHWLVCRPDFPDAHAYLVAAVLTEHAATIPDAAPADLLTIPVPIHPGARAYAMGEAIEAAKLPTAVRVEP